MHPHVVVTHTDDKELYVWDVEKQPNRAHDKARATAYEQANPEVVHAACEPNSGKPAEMAKPSPTS